MTPTADSSYQCNLLDGPSDVRLITLSSGTRDEPICLKIKHASLDQRPTYEALWYVWGPQAPECPVKCNVASLGVGSNLRDALLCLRKPDSSRVLWTDRITINQEDLDERARQFGLMGDIYGSSFLVLI
jgi:hypothetical protein